MLLSLQDFKENVCIMAKLFEEHPAVAEHFMLAVKKALSCLAPKEAFKHFKSRIELLDKNFW